MLPRAAERDGSNWCHVLPAATRRARPAEWVLEEGSTDQSDADIAKELVREQLFRRLNQELPYTLDPEHVSQRTLQDGSVRFEQIIWVPNETVRPFFKIIGY